MADIIATLKQDHINMSRLLDALEREIDRFAAGGHADLEVVSAVARYVLEYPDRFHHPVEDLLLAALRARKPAAARAAEGLESEHQRIGRLARTLAAAVETVASDEPARRSSLIDAARNYISAMRDHIALEDARFIPAAEANLSAVDLERLNGALPQMEDPLFGTADRESYARLRRSVLEWAVPDDTV